MIMGNSFKSQLKQIAVTTLALQAIIFCAPVFAAEDANKEQLALKLPEPTVKGTPDESAGDDPNLEPIPVKPISFLVPKGVQNVALGKTVISSVPPYGEGQLSQITDGKKEPVDEQAVEFKKGVQWVQVDLGAPHELYALAIWHDHRLRQVVRCVIVQVSNDPEFKSGVTTLFNNDTENLAGLGAGTDRQYFETRFGKVIDAKGTKARYIRGYTKGTVGESALNVWQEIEVYGLPVK